MNEQFGNFGHKTSSDLQISNKFQALRNVVDQRGSIREIKDLVFYVLKMQVDQLD